MTTTSENQAAASAQQITLQGNSIINVLTQIKKVLASGVSANTANGSPGFTPTQLATALGSNNLATINALIAALPTD